MIAVVQRVLSASVETDGEVIGEIGHGLLALVAVERRDTEADVAWMSNRISGLRIFEDNAGKMNLGCEEVGGKLLVVSNFTVAGDTQKGRRPSFDNAASFETGKAHFENLLKKLAATGTVIKTGAYGEEMRVSLVNDGPITLIVESPSG
ncbi:MAG: D-aminoacyl-tRNA deacylase [Armatimonadota bacterium]|nr:D-aminoacyl-tRNA deacylase [Armatimonadota bacterium]